MADVLEELIGVPVSNQTSDPDPVRAQGAGQLIDVVRAYSDQPWTYRYAARPCRDRPPPPR